MRVRAICRQIVDGRTRGCYNTAVTLTDPVGQFLNDTDPRPSISGQNVHFITTTVIVFDFTKRLVAADIIGLKLP